MNKWNHVLLRYYLFPLIPSVTKLIINYRQARENLSFTEAKVQAMS